jgi:hypothetical protein
MRMSWLLVICVLVICVLVTGLGTGFVIFLKSVRIAGYAAAGFTTLFK